MSYPYYTNTVQVKFYWNGEWSFGIAYGGWIVDGLYGELLSTKDVIANAARDNIDYDDAIIELSWNDLRETIAN